MNQPKIVIIAGPNGAGKTTFARAFLPQEAQCPHFINADLIAAGLSPFAPEAAAIKAGRLMLEEIAACTSRRESFAFERGVVRQRPPGADSYGVGRSTMILDQLSQAKDKDLPASLIAMRRAAHVARVTAVRTETAIVVLRDHKPLRISADELRKAGVK